MTSTELSRPFPDYVVCPRCYEPEVEVWCYAVQAICHNCGLVFSHALPEECRPVCTDEIRVLAAQHTARSNDPHACAKILQRGTPPENIES